MGGGTKYCNVERTGLQMKKPGFSHQLGSLHHDIGSIIYYYSVYTIVGAIAATYMYMHIALVGLKLLNTKCS